MSYMTDKDKYKVYTVSENASSIDFIFSKEKKAPLFIYFYDYNGSQGESVVQGRCKQVLYTHYSQTLQFVCHLSLSLSLTHSLVWIWRVVAGEGKDYFFGRFKHKNILISKEFRIPKWNHSK